MSKDTLVLSGGSVKGIALLGSLKALEEKSIMKDIKTIAGTSIGGIIAALYIIGYDAEELFDFLNELDLRVLQNFNFDGLLTKFGIDDGKNLVEILKILFKAKDVAPTITFKELYEKSNIKLILTTVCINDKKVYYISYDNFPNMEVITGLRMTSALPLLFTPVEYENKVYVDGGIMNNYPMNLFSDNLESAIGIYLSDERQVIDTVPNIETYFSHFLNCIFEGVIQTLIRNYEKYTVKINLPNTNIFDLNINSETRKQLYTIGYDEMMKFLDKK